MGQTIGWRKYNSDGSSEWANTPDWFNSKWAGRFEWYISIFDGETESRDECPVMGDGYYRPKDFTVFRATLDALQDIPDSRPHHAVFNMDEIRGQWKECTDWLESHPDVFINYG